MNCNGDVGSGVLEIARQVNEFELRRELNRIAEIPIAKISRRERERLIVRKAISHLPSNCRMILFLKFWEGETFSEIAAAIGFSVESVRVSYVLALGYLERELSPYILEAKYFMRQDISTA